MKCLKGLKVIETCTLHYQESKSIKKNEIFDIHVRCARAERAHVHVQTANFEMLKMAWFVL